MIALEEKTGKEPVTTLADRIRRCRRGLGMTKAQLALSARLPRVAISRYERNQTKDMSAKILRKLTPALGVSADYLAGRREDEVYFQNPRREKLVKNLRNLDPADIQWMHELYLLLSEKRH